MDDLRRDTLPITVVVPCYKSGRSAVRAVESVLRSRRPPQGVVVVIDGTAALDAKYLEPYVSERCKVLVNEVNRGAPYSRNRGLAEARSEYVMFLDADDYVEGELISGIVQEMAERRADVGFGPWRTECESTGRRGRRFVPFFTSQVDWFWKWFVDGAFVPTCSFVWRTEFVQNLGGWDTLLKRNQDGDIAMRAAMAGAIFAVSHQGTGIYSKRPGGVSISTNVETLSLLAVVPEKLLGIDSRAIPESVKRRACAEHYYNIAWSLFEKGDACAGWGALRRSRELGFMGHRGPLLHRWAASILGLPVKSRVVATLKRWRR